MKRSIISVAILAVIFLTHYTVLKHSEYGGNTAILTLPIFILCYTIVLLITFKKHIS